MQELPTKKLEGLSGEILAALNLQKQCEEREGADADYNQRIFERCVAQFAEYLTKALKKLEFSEEDLNAIGLNQEKFTECFAENISLKPENTFPPLSIAEANIEKALNKYVARVSVTLDSDKGVHKKWQEINLDLFKQKSERFFRGVKNVTIDGYTAKTTKLDPENLEKFVEQAIALRRVLIDDGLIKDKPVIINAPTPEKLKALEDLFTRAGLAVVKEVEVKESEAKASKSVDEDGRPTTAKPASPREVNSGAASDDETAVKKDDKGKGEADSKDPDVTSILSPGKK